MVKLALPKHHSGAVGPFGMGHYRIPSIKALDIAFCRITAAVLGPSYYHLCLKPAHTIAIQPFWTARLPTSDRLWRMQLVAQYTQH